MINAEIIKVHAGQILPCRRVTGNKEFTIGGLMHGAAGFHTPRARQTGRLYNQLPLRYDPMNVKSHYMHLASTTKSYFP